MEDAVMKSKGSRKEQGFAHRHVKSNSTNQRVKRYSFHYVLPAVTLAAFIMAVILFSARTPSAEAALQDKGSVAGIGESAARQIQALLDEKEARTPAQRKIDSQLLYSLKLHRKEAISGRSQCCPARPGAGTRGRPCLR
jgi:hypothetical protein